MIMGVILEDITWIIDGAMDIWMKYVMPGRLMETHAIYFYCIGDGKEVPMVGINALVSSRKWA